MYPKTLRAVLALSILWTVAAGAADAPAKPRDQAADARAIQTSFSQYREALLAGDGAKAADAVSARTIAFYDGIVRHALTTPRPQLLELDLISKLMVLRMRHEFTRSQLAAMTGRDALVTGVSKGWISKSSVANVERLVDIEVGSAEASASMPGAAGIPVFRFVNEAGQWKLDLVASFGLAGAAMKEAVTKSGLTEEQFIVRLLAIASSKQVDERIFSPPAP